MSDRMEAALECAERGWKIVPLRARGKIPMLPEWQKNASDDPDQIEKWFEARANTNIGLQLGPRSGVIDIEGDEEGYEAELLELFGGDMPVTPTWKANRGKHRLFKFRDDLPPKAVIHIGKLEIRIGAGDKGAQSVIPPSIHPKGDLYEWLVSPADCDVAEIPDEVMTKIWNQQGDAGGATSLVPAGRTGEEWKRLAGGVGEGERNEAAAALIGRDLASRHLGSTSGVEAAWDAIWAWNEGNSPPMAEKELRSTFNQILSRERRRRLEEPGPRSKEAMSFESTTEGWRMETVMSEPKEYRLYTNWWDGYISLNKNQLYSPLAICIEAAEQKNIAPPLPLVKAIWEGTRDRPGVRARVVETAEQLAAPSGHVRTAVVAERILEYLSDFRLVEDGKEPNHRHCASKTEDGVFWVRETAIVNAVAREADRITRADLVRLLEVSGAKKTRLRSSRASMYRLPPAVVDTLSELADHTTPPVGTE